MLFYAPRGLVLILVPFFGACGLTSSDPDHEDPPGSSTGEDPADDIERPVEYFEGDLPETCTNSELRIGGPTGDMVWDVGYRERLVGTTSWDSFYIRTHTLPLADGGLVSGWGESGEPFVDGEVRTLDKSMVLFPNSTPALLCAGGDSQVIVKDGRGYLKLSGLGPLGCGDEVEGSLTYCSSAYCSSPASDSYRLAGTLDGRDETFTTGEKDFRAGTFNFQIGFSHLVATTNTEDGELYLEEGAFLNLVTGELYCIGSVEGAIEEGAIGQVTFSEFRRALPCGNIPEGPSIEGCFEEAQAPDPAED